MKQIDVLKLDKEDPKRIIALQRQEIENLKREVEQWKEVAQQDIRSGMIFSDKQKATELKFRQVKITTRAMKKMGKQVGMAARYIAQRLDNVDMGAAADLRFISTILERDYWGHELVMDTMDTIHMGEIKASDLITNTQAYAGMVEISRGENSDGCNSR